MARYADGLLADGERIELRTRQHWFAIVAFTIWFWVFAVVAILFFLLGQWIRFEPFGWLSLAGLVLALIWLVWRYIGWSFQDYIVTNRRVIKVEGILTKQSADSSLEKINDAVLRQGVLARLLGYGDLEILTAAETTVDRFRMLNRPTDFKKAMLNAKYALERDISAPMPSPPLRAAAEPSAPADVSGPPRDAAPTPIQGASVTTAPTSEPARPMTADEVTATLHQLADLRDRGAISVEDYEAKKSELLGRL